MNGEIYQKILQDFDNSLSEPAIIQMDNFSGHKVDDSFQTFKFIIPVFLPPSSTLKTQPLDAGIISIFKMKYTQKFMNYALGKMKNGSFKLN